MFEWRFLPKKLVPTVDCMAQKVPYRALFGSSVRSRDVCFFGTFFAFFYNFSAFFRRFLAQNPYIFLNNPHIYRLQIGGSKILVIHRCFLKKRRHFLAFFSSYNVSPRVIGFLGRLYVHFRPRCIEILFNFRVQKCTESKVYI